MVTPELKWPMTNFTPSAANLLAVDTPSLGSARSSPMLIESFWPRMPPAALMSSTACSTPFLSWAPNAALPPVIGPPTASLICACAPVASPNAKPIAKPTVLPKYLIRIVVLPVLGADLIRDSVQKSRRFHRRAALCRPSSGGPAQEAILACHLAGARGAKAQGRAADRHRGVEPVGGQRQQGAVEQREVDEPHRGAENEH